MGATLVICNRCSTDIDAGANFCRKCGSAVANYCRACGAPQSPGSQFCSRCGAGQIQNLPAIAIQKVVVTDASFASYPPYYQQEFRRINATGEAYKGKWNWAAFFFCAIWALTKGLWLPALICFVGGLLTGGVVAFAYSFIFATRGNYMYYCKEIKRCDIPV